MRNRSGFALVIGSLIFVALGLLFAQLGPVLAELATRTVSTLAAVGAVFTALYLGALVTQSVAGGAIDRAGSRPVLLVGLVVTATGMIGIALSRSLAVLLAWACFSGL